MHPTATATLPRTLALGLATTFTAALMGNAPTANATCASFFGLGSGGNCTSSFTSIAVAIGKNASAHAEGILGAAVTVGASSTASTTAGALWNLAVTFGERNATNAGGIGSVAMVARSRDQVVLAGDGGLGSGNIANLAVSLASPQATETIANGIANATVNVAGSGNVYGRGVGLTTVNAIGLGVTLYNSGTLNNITNMLGNNTFASNLEGAFGTLAFNLIGENNALYTKGALAIAGAVGSTGQTVTQSGPGISVRFNRQSLSSRRLRATAGIEAGAIAAQPTSRAARSLRSHR